MQLSPVRQRFNTNLSPSSQPTLLALYRPRPRATTPVLRLHRAASRQRGSRGPPTQ